MDAVKKLQKFVMTDPGFRAARSANCKTAVHSYPTYEQHSTVLPGTDALLF
jgi:hypothetical protein